MPKDYRDFWIVTSFVMEDTWTIFYENKKITRFRMQHTHGRINLQEEITLILQQRQGAAQYANESYSFYEGGA